MAKEKFIEKIIEQFLDYSGTPIYPETILRELEEWDSLTGMAIQLMIKDDFNSSIPDEEFQNIKTVDDLYNLMIKYKQ